MVRHPRRAREARVIRLPSAASDADAGRDPSLVPNRTGRKARAATLNPSGGRDVAVARRRSAAPARLRALERIDERPQLVNKDPQLEGLQEIGSSGGFDRRERLFAVVAGDEKGPASELRMHFLEERQKIVAAHIR